MKLMNQPFALFLAAALLLSSGCARHIVNNPTEAYESMGAVEENVSTKAPILTVLTLGFVREHSYKRLTKRLNCKLERTARNKYGADAVNNIQYWPSPDSDAKIDVLYARGEMIRYKKFGTPAEPAAAG
jgi:hypothetical protein